MKDEFWRLGLFDFFSREFVPVGDSEHLEEVLAKEEMDAKRALFRQEEEFFGREDAPSSVLFLAQGLPALFNP